MEVRPFADSDADAVREFFVRVNHLWSPLYERRNSPTSISLPVHHIWNYSTQSYPRSLCRPHTPRSPAAKGPERALVDR